VALQPTDLLTECGTLGSSHRQVGWESGESFDRGRRVNRRDGTAAAT